MAVGALGVQGTTAPPVAPPTLLTPTQIKTEPVIEPGSWWDSGERYSGSTTSSVSSTTIKDLLDDVYITHVDTAPHQASSHAAV